ncbi:hypothetical protein GGR56DRAFT_600496 [Xylariaceae sp. FL0804]|nr:hypothetical protein GGR56DRAFT_600496 [Xylariaceae sp. FL0804]
MEQRASQWLQTDVRDIDAAPRQLLETYSGIPADEVVPHVLAVRDKAFALYPWPCIGQMRFLRLSLASYPAYPRILELLRADDLPQQQQQRRRRQYLDLGCCFGQDMRKLVVDGARADQLVGLDLVPEFHALGHELFRDSRKLAVEFYARDILADDDEADWAPLLARFDVLHLTSFLHIWDWAGQARAAARVATLTRGPGALLVGSQLGSAVGGEFPNLEGTGTNYRQSPETFARFWDEVGATTGTRWEVRTTFRAMDVVTRTNMHQDWAEPNMGLLLFEVTRTA